ncbi:MAG: hypothetical protein ACD_39C00954G0004, partial [uncultured bacterium]
MIQKNPTTLREGLVLFVGCLLATLLPYVIVPVALLVALTAYALKVWRRRHPDTPLLTDMLMRGQVVVTTRVVLLLLFGTLPLMLAKSHSGALALCFVYNFVVLVLVATDILISPRPDHLTIER